MGVVRSTPNGRNMLMSDQLQSRNKTSEPIVPQAGKVVSCVAIGCGRVTERPPDLTCSTANILLKIFKGTLYDSSIDDSAMHLHFHKDTEYPINLPFLRSSKLLAAFF